MADHGDHPDQAHLHFLSTPDGKCIGPFVTQERAVRHARKEGLSDFTLLQFCPQEAVKLHDKERIKKGEATKEDEVEAFVQCHLAWLSEVKRWPHAWLCFNALARDSQPAIAAHSQTVKVAKELGLCQTA